MNKGAVSKYFGIIVLLKVRGVSFVLALSGVESKFVTMHKVIHSYVLPSRWS